METNISAMDKEREAEKRRKSSVEFKKQRRENFIKKKARNQSDQNRERVLTKVGCH